MVQTRGAIRPGKVQCNWRIDSRAVELARTAAQEHGFSSVPQLVNFILLKALGNQKIQKIVLGGP